MHINKSVRLLDPFYSAKQDAAGRVKEFFLDPEATTVLVPYCNSRHWTLIVATREITYFYDPLFNPPDEHMEHIIQKLEAPKVEMMNTKEHPIQKDSWSCGVHVSLMYLSFISDTKWTPRQATHDVKNFRERMKAEMELDYQVQDELPEDVVIGDGSEDEDDVVAIEHVESDEEYEKEDVDELEQCRRAMDESTGGVELSGAAEGVEPCGAAELVSDSKSTIEETADVVTTPWVSKKPEHLHLETSLENENPVMVNPSANVEKDETEVPETFKQADPETSFPRHQVVPWKRNCRKMKLWRHLETRTTRWMWKSLRSVADKWMSRMVQWMTELDNNMFITSDYFLKKSDPIAHVLPGSFLKIAKEMLPYNVTESIDPPCRECAESDCAGTIPSWHAATHANRLDHDLNMFRGCVEQVYQMQIFRSFPGSQRIIGTELCEAYSTIGMVYEGMKRKTEFLCKNDIFIFIQNVVFATFPEMESYVCATFLGLRLRWEEQKLGDTLEYIPWSQDIARRLDLKLSEHLQSVLLKTKDTGMKGSKFQDVWREFEALIPEEWSRMNRQKSKILRNLVKHAHTRSLERNHDHILMLTALLPIIQKFIDDHKFNVPNAELPEAERSPKYVRIFIDKKDNQIVMTEELDRALNLIPSDTQRNPLDNWETIPLKEAYGKSLRIDPTLTFIKVPQDLTTFGEVPTRTPGWTYCKRAVDVLFEVIGDMFFGLQVFQKIEEREEGAAGWELLKSWAKEMEKWFPADVTSTYFMSNHKIEEIRNAAINHFAPLHNVKVPSMMLHFKHLDCTESSRTTLVELDMCHVFPGMEATAEIVDTALKRKIPEIYKCHLMNGVLNCVYIHFFKEFPQLAKFVHNQKGCNRVVSTECCHKTTAVRDNVLPDLHPQGEKIPCNMLDSPLITRRNIQVTIIDELLERSRPYIQEEEIKK